MQDYRARLLSLAIGSEEITLITELISSRLCWFCQGLVQLSGVFQSDRVSQSVAVATVCAEIPKSTSVEAPAPTTVCIC